MILQEGNVRIRPAILPDDIHAAVPWYQDPEVLYYSEGGESAAPYDAERVEKMYKYLLNKGEVYIIEKEEEGGWLAIGDAALCSDCLPIVIGDGRYRSQGIGKRVLKLLIRRAEAVGIARLLVNGVYTFNERSRRMYEGVGFKPIETYVDGDGIEATRFEMVLPMI
ncbi:GNAT family N-acetyltransferase [Paenibacillus thermotolerans]|uniref:GNAT family N-acetyltransferase n=1 Tax=Paenibacillus thermotolerans TaxID=3027807 RepID=UPI00236816BD|nr:MULTISPECIES: GNAT family protein [unclassified Paenibacillus]